MKQGLVAGLVVCCCALPLCGHAAALDGGSHTVVSNSSWNIGSADLWVGGTTTSNSLSIIQGGEVFDWHAYLGYSSNSTHNAVLVSGEGSVWSNTSHLYMGHYGGDNRLTISDGARVYNWNTYVGYRRTSGNNSMEVVGADTVWTNRGTLQVGQYGPGNSLAISGGGRVFSEVAYIGVGHSSSSNVVSVSGSGSAWSVVDDLNVGDYGSGNVLEVSDGGRLNSGEATVGLGSAGENNVVRVTGAGSVWSNANDLVVGGDGEDNALEISSGGQVYSGSANVGATSGSFYDTENNHVLVTGDGSVWSNRQDLAIGLRGSSGNSLDIADGGRVYNHHGLVGYFRFGTSIPTEGNAASVSGAGSEWNNAGDLTVGSAYPDCRLDILDGGCVTSVNGYIGRGWTNNTALVSGAGSVWSLADRLHVGFDGSGNSLVVTNGGIVESLNGSVGYGQYAYDNSVVLVGSNSVWRSAGRLGLGGYMAEEGWVNGGTGNALHVGDLASVETGDLHNRNQSRISLDADGRILVAGNYFQSADSELEYVCVSNAAGAVTVAGDAIWDGRLRVEFPAGFVPELGTLLDLFDWGGAVSGGFATKELPDLPNALGWDVSDLYSSGRLAVVPNPDQDGDGLPDEWEQRYFQSDVSPTNNPDGDCHNNLQEFIAGMNPTNAASCFAITNAVAGSSGFELSWPVQSNRLYSVLWGTLDGDFETIETYLEFPQNSFTDTIHSVEAKGFYRVDVRLK